MTENCKNWRGNTSIEVVWNGSQADPDLVYNGYTFNYWDIEDALWGDFLEVTGCHDNACNDPEVEEEFNKYVQNNAVNYLEDCIYSNYFAKGSKNWHDMYKQKEEC